MRIANQARLASSEPLEEKPQLAVTEVKEVKEVGEKEKEIGEGDLW